MIKRKIISEVVWNDFFIECTFDELRKDMKAIEYSRRNSNFISFEFDINYCGDGTYLNVIGKRYETDDEYTTRFEKEAKKLTEADEKDLKEYNRLKVKFG